MPRISVIIPAYNEEGVVGECLESLANQEWGDYEALVVDDCSEDKTKDIVQSWVARDSKRFRLLEFGKVGPGKARNLAALQAQGEILAFTDADCVARPDWLKELIRGLESDDVAATGGPQLAHPRSSDFQLKVEKILNLVSPVIDFYSRHDDGKIREARHNPLCNVAYRKQIYLEFGGFREDLFPGEDIELDLRLRKAGKRITTNPRAVVFHHRPEDIGRWRKVMRAYGRAQGKLARERGFERKIQWLAPGFLLFIGSLWVVAGSQWGLWGILGGSFVVLLIVLFRPKGHSLLSILWNTLEWFNGFVMGFVTNQSLPPKFKKTS